MQRQHVLNDELRRIAMLAVDVLLDVEAYDVVALGEQALRPAAEPAEKVHRERFHSVTIGGSTGPTMSGDSRERDGRGFNARPRRKAATSEN